MSEEWERLMEILEASQKKNGDKPITISHLLNIVKMIDRDMQREGQLHDMLEGRNE